MLGDVASAREEFARLSSATRAEPEVIEVEWGLHAEAQAWKEALEAAQRLVEKAPDRPFGWIHRAYALRRIAGGGLSEAWGALRPAHDLFPKEYLIPYNLACYAAQLERREEAWEWLQLAMALGKRAHVKKLALADHDLESLWPRIREDTPV